MMRFKKIIISAVIIFYCGCLTCTGVSPAPLFQSHGVLQHGKPVPIWGSASPLEVITVTFSDQSRTTTADQSGHWQVWLSPMDAASEGRDLIIAGTECVILSDVVVGEVWVAAGQSNMAWRLKDTTGASIDIPAAHEPLVREFKITRTIAESPQSFVEGNWSPATSFNVSTFGAISYYFALDVHRTLKIPIGIINCSYGGSRIEAWLDHDTLSSDPKLAETFSEWDQALQDYPQARKIYELELQKWETGRLNAASAGMEFTQRTPRIPWGPGHFATPSGLYHGMLHPVLPYATRGILWYQGESNAHAPEAYRIQFPALIRSWREAFGQGDIPFYWVQLASFGSPTGTNWAELRDAQSSALDLPQTGQAISIDLGTPSDIHPRNKRDVGRRLARLALNRTYGISMMDGGPVPVSATLVDGEVVISFHPENGDPVSLYSTDVLGLEVAGSDKVYREASAHVSGNRVIVNPGEVQTPAFVRYAWRNAPRFGLFNEQGLPTPPFKLAVKPEIISIQNENH